MSETNPSENNPKRKRGKAERPPRLMARARSLFSSFPRRREPKWAYPHSTVFVESHMWVPACAGKTNEGGKDEKGNGDLL